MSHSHSSPLEVTQALLNCARAAGFQFGEDTALVAVQHMLQQTVDLFQTAAGMGLNLKNIFALGKVYSNSARSSRHCACDGRHCRRLSDAAQPANSILILTRIRIDYGKWRPINSPGAG
jgi:hypothetical protein